MLMLVLSGWHLENHQIIDSLNPSKLGLEFLSSVRHTGEFRQPPIVSSFCFELLSAVFDSQSMTYFCLQFCH